MTFGWYFRTDWESVLDNFSEYCHEKITDCAIRSYISKITPRPCKHRRRSSEVHYPTFIQRRVSPFVIADTAGWAVGGGGPDEEEGQQTGSEAEVTLSFHPPDSPGDLRDSGVTWRGWPTPGHRGVLVFAWDWLCLNFPPGSARLQLVQTDNKSEIVELRLEERPCLFCDSSLWRQLKFNPRPQDTQKPL